MNNQIANVIKKTKRDYWIEMSIRETSTQCHFADIAYNNIDKKSAKPTDQAFSSIHSFLSHCAMVSKMLQAKEESRPTWARSSKLFGIEINLKRAGKTINPKTVGDILGVSANSIVHKRTFRNHLEHYDERLKQWIGRFAEGANIGTYNIGSKKMFQGGNMILVSHYNPVTKTFTFVNQDFDLEELHDEIKRIQTLADDWVHQIQFNVISPPYG